ncbi:MAG: hypothetical protein REI96_21570 [Flavobacterium nitrogenifigens]|uniref:DUF4843 domain-containing protein n=1 Tax=Flavobacterium nitrogenifigens TaxID=1617283 RepID=A0A521AIS2_9FLAO|nr:hypothetical protein [Flavobacterium nitrogenifigens]KAF2331578.1 hypothetical protein DM397_12650 [Flavobacterium nitrogenifigens]MDQ8015049.1 hypothetical protein [Flavobacterium nitrogenifigens]SMO34651.1 hypothetical protein SAMN06265220_101183 [Flavobacterium nitrogenifigens]
MKRNLIQRISMLLFAAVFFLSCSSDLDFDQVNDFKLEPVFVANLAYFDIPANKLEDDGSTNVYPDVRDFDIFKDKFFNERLKKAEFDFEIENNINRSFVINMLLLNAENQVLQTISFTVPSYNGTPNVIKYPTEVFENARLDLLKQTQKIGFVIIIAAGPPLNSESLGNLKLRSSATAYLEIE